MPVQPLPGTRDQARNPETFGTSKHIILRFLIFDSVPRENSKEKLRKRRRVEKMIHKSYDMYEEGNKTFVAPLRFCSVVGDLPRL